MKFKAVYLGMGLLIVCLVFVFPFTAGYFDVVDLAMERVNIRVHPDRVEAEAVYTFRNSWPLPVAQRVRLPLSEAPDRAGMLRFEAWQISPVRRKLSGRTGNGGRGFRLVFPAGGEVTLKAVYTQTARENTARFALTGWAGAGHRERGEYRLDLHGVELLRSNYRLKASDNVSVMFGKTDFTPNRDWVFSWRAAN